jgi:hypothetical protein
VKLTAWLEGKFRSALQRNMVFPACTDIHLPFLIDECELGSPTVLPFTVPGDGAQQQDAEAAKSKKREKKKKAEKSEKPGKLDVADVAKDAAEQAGALAAEDSKVCCPDLERTLLRCRHRLQAIHQRLNPCSGTFAAVVLLPALTCACSVFGDPERLTQCLQGSVRQRAVRKLKKEKTRDGDGGGGGASNQNSAGAVAGAPSGHSPLGAPSLASGNRSRASRAAPEDTAADRGASPDTPRRPFVRVLAGGIPRLFRRGGQGNQAQAGADGANSQLPPPPHGLPDGSAANQAQVWLHRRYPAGLLRLVQLCQTHCNVDCLNLPIW